MDLITDLPKSHNYDAILTIVDQGCSKAAKFLPCNKTIDGQGVAQLYFQHLFPWFESRSASSQIAIPDLLATLLKQFAKRLASNDKLTEIKPRSFGSFVQSVHRTRVESGIVLLYACRFFYRLQTALAKW